MLTPRPGGWSCDCDPALDDAPFPALLLLVAGAYQFSPLKRICLTRCRTPMGFLVGEWRGVGQQRAVAPFAERPDVRRARRARQLRDVCLLEMHRRAPGLHVRRHILEIERRPEIPAQQRLERVAARLRG